MKFRKKPVVIDAVQWTGTNVNEMEAFLGSYPHELHHESDEGFSLTIHTLEGDHFANVGDYIIRGVQGEFYPCKPDIFQETYEPYEEPPKRWFWYGR